MVVTHSKPGSALIKAVTSDLALAATPHFFPCEILVQ